LPVLPLRLPGQRKPAHWQLAIGPPADQNSAGQELSALRDLQARTKAAIEAQQARGEPGMNDTYSRAGNAADPPSLSPDYRSTTLRSPSRPLVLIPQTLSEITGPVYGHSDVEAAEADLTRQHAGEPLGERILVQGRVLDEAGRAVPNTLIEIWQCNAAGRYIHETDQHSAPLDPNFSGAGRVVTDADGHYRFTTIKPGAYPWRNHPNAWRPAHIHLSLFGPSFLTRLATQMYFPGDPLFPFDPIFNSVIDAKARERMVCRFDMECTRPEWALGYVFDIVLRGPAATPPDLD
jgi:protocatechuate 3,4-dioxygenase, beta subunit